jgi:hypothetical protein
MLCNYFWEFLVRTKKNINTAGIYKIARNVYWKYTHLTENISTILFLLPASLRHANREFVSGDQEHFRNWFQITGPWGHFLCAMITGNDFLCPQIGPKARTRRSNAVSAVLSTTSDRRGTRAWRHRAQCSASPVNVTRYAKSLVILSAELVSSTTTTIGHDPDILPPSSHNISKKSILNMILPSQMVHSHSVSQQHSSSWRFLKFKSQLERLLFYG